MTKVLLCVAAGLLLLALVPAYAAYTLGARVGDALVDGRLAFAGIGAALALGMLVALGLGGAL